MSKKCPGISQDSGGYPGYTGISRISKECPEISRDVQGISRNVQGMSGYVPGYLEKSKKNVVIYKVT